MQCLVDSYRSYLSYQNERSVSRALFFGGSSHMARVFFSVMNINAWVNRILSAFRGSRKKTSADDFLLNCPYDNESARTDWMHRKRTYTFQQAEM